MRDIIPAPDRRRRASVGSPQALVETLTDLDLELADRELVAELTRGLHWDHEPERFQRAAQAELAWRREQGVAFGWVKV